MSLLLLHAYNHQVQTFFFCTGVKSEKYFISFETPFEITVNSSDGIRFEHAAAVRACVCMCVSQRAHVVTERVYTMNSP